jgi:hypothetical protein
MSATRNPVPLAAMTAAAMPAGVAPYTITSKSVDARRAWAAEAVVATAAQTSSAVHRAAMVECKCFPADAGGTVGTVRGHNDL